MSGNQTMELEKYHDGSSHKKRDTHQCIRHQLSRDVNEVQGRRHAALVLSYGVAHCHEQGWQECRTNAGEVVDTLEFLSQRQVLG